jgi:hypothetical protein
MRLVAIYIPQNSLPYIFGKDHLGQTLNLGGRFLYTFTENQKTIEAGLLSENQNFIENFWGGEYIINISHSWQKWQR